MNPEHQIRRATWWVHFWGATFVASQLAFFTFTLYRLLK